MANITKDYLRNLIDTNLADFSNITPDRHREVLHTILECIQYQGDIRFIRMQNSDIPVYFDTSGLGRVNLQYEGWAICNGNNGTIDDGGRTYIGYKPGEYPKLNAQGGEKEHKLTKPEMPIHKHKTSVTTAYDGGPISFDGGDNKMNIYLGDTNSEGGDQPHNNMQPYTVILKIQKI